MSPNISVLIPNLDPNEEILGDGGWKGNERAEIHLFAVQFCDSFSFLQAGGGQVSICGYELHPRRLSPAYFWQLAL